MKTSFIILITFITFFSGCMQSKKASQNSDIEIVQATYEDWSEVSPVESDVREQGTDLELTVRNWPEGAVPEHIVFRNRKSFSAEITDTIDSEIKIEARIIRRSAVLSERSESVELSDRLVYTGSDGEPGFIEIDDWKVKEES